MLRPVAALLFSTATLAQDVPALIDKQIADAAVPGVIRSSIGVTRKDTPIRCLITADDLDYNTPKTRILLIGGLEGSEATAGSALAAMKWFYDEPEARSYRSQFALSAVPIANPDGWAVGTAANASGGSPVRGYPPKGEAYASPTEPEAQYLWRWI